MSKRGEVVLVYFPNSNLSSAKLRPALVVQANGLHTGLPQTIVVAITSNMARTGHGSRVLISLSTIAGQRTGLKSDSVIMTDNLVTVSHSEIRRSIGIWLEMDEVDVAIKFTLGLT